MAKKASRKKPQQKDLIPGWDGLTAAMKRAANQYREASLDKSKAVSIYKAKKDNLMSIMEDEDIPFVRIELDGVAKHVRLEERQVLKLETAKEITPEDGDEQAK